MAKVLTRGIATTGYGARLVRKVCALAGSPTIIEDTRVSLAASGVLDAVRYHDDATLFDWLIDVLSYQGVSDAIATSYMEKHGRITAPVIARSLKRKPACTKLKSYWQFHDCRYQKSLQTCGEPSLLAGCPLPRHDLRNGRLNQSAYNLFLFFRDIADGDFIGWLDSRLALADDINTAHRPERLANAVLEPMTHIYGISHKVLNMSLSMLLLAGDADRERWRTAGATMIAVDTLVHNWLHRTGILKRFDANHLYGPNCYSDTGCAAIIRKLATEIDTRAYDPTFPRVFPRYLQYAIWQFCAQSAVDRCNGNRIDDRKPCHQNQCPLYERCGHVTLHKPQPAAVAS